MAQHTQPAITILNTVTTTYGISADVNNAALPGFNKHRVNVISGDVDVDYLDGGGISTLTAIETAKTPTIQNEYVLTGVKQFSLTANADSVVVITSWTDN